MANKKYKHDLQIHFMCIRNTVQVGGTKPAGSRHLHFNRRARTGFYSGPQQDDPAKPRNTKTENSNTMLALKHKADLNFLLV